MFQEVVSPSSMQLDKYYDKLKLLVDQYSGDPYMQQRLETHIMNILPATLDNEYKTHERRISRTHFLTNEQQVFVQIFLNKYPYFYLHTNSCFYHYNGKNYSAVKEDDIIQQLLSTISKDRTLMQWRHKTKINIIKQIKERNLFKSVPETDTIQYILKMLYTTIFSNKHQVKYFLTVLGDNILKKNPDLIFLIKPKTKKIITEIENIAYVTIGIANITSNIVTKFHENYNYENCRLLKLNDTFSIDMWRELLRTHGLDLLCVAAHYSSRYGNSEQFIQNNINDEIKSYALFLKNNNQATIIDSFCANSITELVVSIPSSTKISITWKNMHYIWKQYISSIGLPNTIYSSALKKILCERFNYDEGTDTFYNVTSKYLPYIGNFITFWEHNIVYAENKFENEFELDELCELFEKWMHDNGVGNNNSITEHDVLKIIVHFFPVVDIVENKYVLNIQCKLWNKSLDIDSAISALKEEGAATPPSLVSIGDIYDYYVTFCNTKNNSVSTKFVVSKRYFEKYVCSVLSDYIVFDNFISW